MGRVKDYYFDEINDFNDDDFSALFEDGSGVKFNFKLKGEDKKQYINLKNIHYKEIKNYIEQITNKF